MNDWPSECFTVSVVLCCLKCVPDLLQTTNPLLHPEILLIPAAYLRVLLTVLVLHSKRSGRVPRFVAGICSLSKASLPQSVLQHCCTCAYSKKTKTATESRFVIQQFGVWALVAELAGLVYLKDRGWHEQCQSTPATPATAQVFVKFGRWGSRIKWCGHFK